MGYKENFIEKNGQKNGVAPLQRHCHSFAKCHCSWPKNANDLNHFGKTTGLSANHNCNLETTVRFWRPGVTTSVFSDNLLLKINLLLVLRECTWLDKWHIIGVGFFTILAILGGMAQAIWEPLDLLL